MSRDDVWENLIKSPGSVVDTASIDQYLSPTEVVGLPSHENPFQATSRNPIVGSRVAFCGNLEALLSYPNPPAPNTKGTVVMVRTAMGDQTGDGYGRIFVKWDDGRFLPIFAGHATTKHEVAKVASVVGVVQTAAGVTDLDGFLRMSSTSNDLIHKATRDLWSLQTSPAGDVYLARLFQENGDPLKV